MTPTDQLSPVDIVRFYLEAGVDSVLQDEPVNRLAEPQKPPAQIAQVTAPLQAAVADRKSVV